MYRITFASSGPHVGHGVCPATCAAKWLGVYWLPIASKYDSSILSIASKYNSSILSIASECLFKVLMFDKQMFI